MMIPLSNLHRTRPRLFANSVVDDDDARSTRSALLLKGTSLRWSDGGHFGVKPGGRLGDGWSSLDYLATLPAYRYYTACEHLTMQYAIAELHLNPLHRRLLRPSSASGTQAPEINGAHLQQSVTRTAPHCPLWLHSCVYYLISLSCIRNDSRSVVLVFVSGQRSAGKISSPYTLVPRVFRRPLLSDSSSMWHPLLSSSLTSPLT